MDSTVRMPPLNPCSLDKVKELGCGLTAFDPKCLVIPMAKSGIPKSEVEEIGARCRALRSATGLSQVAFCERTRIGKTTWNNYERDRGRPSVTQCRKLKKTLGIPQDWIYDGDEHNIPNWLALKLRQMEDA